MLERELVGADEERVSMAWEDVAEGSAAMTVLTIVLALAVLADGPGPSYAIRIPEMDMGLHFYQKWYMTGNHGVQSLLESMGLKKHLSSHIYFVGIFTVLCLDFTLYCAPGACSSYRYRLIKGK
ncbi:hypothetical protein BU17DRAFT_71715 [Hysterangium stoloniferum]|nr:hypothetical protein BU17DRAFT_71715 [Hysterangium stoloniferum]